MLIDNYLQHSGINAGQLTHDFYVQLAQFGAAIELDQTDPQVQWQYQVPELGEGGACSLFGQLAAKPYDLEQTLGGKTAANEQLLKRVTALVNFYRQHSSSDWFGVYQKRVNPEGQSVLVKLAYYGAASRPEFPLTAEFAAISNNSTVGLSGMGRIINQVGAYRSAGGEYYTCDPKVNAEACLPVLGQNGAVLGIVDSETFLEQTFVGQELALLVAVVMRLATLL
ncbi:L-methionine (R)-S-oxide reductase [Oxalobacteraceae bacterium GrIS 2.11]